MKLPPVLNEKIFYSGELFLRRLIDEEGYWHDNPLVACAFMAPWEVAEAFGLPTSDPTPAIDAFELKPICAGHPCCLSHPADSSWETSFGSGPDVPLYLPTDVWAAVQRKQHGDLGRTWPPLACDADRLLRSIQRHHAAPWNQLQRLAEEAHDLFVLAAALGDVPAGTLSLIASLSGDSVWRIKEGLPNDPRRHYLDAYSKTYLSQLRDVFGMSVPGHSAEWISPSIIPLIESAEAFQDAISQTKWLLYTAVTVHKQQLPEEQHNRMLFETISGDQYADAYFAYLKSRTAAVAKPVEAPGT